MGAQHSLLASTERRIPHTVTGNAMQNQPFIVQLDSLTLKMELGMFYLEVGGAKRVVEVDLNHWDKLEEIGMFLVYIINDISRDVVCEAAKNGTNMLSEYLLFIYHCTPCCVSFP